MSFLSLYTQEKKKKKQTDSTFLNICFIKWGCGFFLFFVFGEDEIDASYQQLV